MKETGVEKFVIVERLIFLSALLLVIIVATATTSHPYTTKNTIENPATLLSFENLLNDNLEVPVAGDIADDQSATKDMTDSQPNNDDTKVEQEQPREDSESTTLEATIDGQKITPTYTTYSGKTVTSSAAPPATTKTSTKPSIDWNIIHIDDNGERLDNSTAPYIPVSNTETTTNTTTTEATTETTVDESESSTTTTITTTTITKTVL